MAPAIFVTAISGLYTSLWGAFKDSPYEGLKKKTFPRSIYFNLAIFGILMATSVFRDDFVSLKLFQIFFLTMGIERLATEAYKMFFRKEDQAKYFIPSRLTFFGKNVESEILRYSIGIASFALAFWVLSFDWQVTTFWQFVVIGYCSGALVAFGGAYKDAPFEGFMFGKFQRSPMVVMSASAIFYFMGPVSIGFLIFMNFGMERFVVEYYKTYIQRNMSGKFLPETKRIEKYLNNREKFHYGALVIIAFTIALYIYEL